MAILKKNGAPNAERVDWREHPGFVKAQQDHAAHKAKIPAMRDRIHPHQQLHHAVREAEQARKRGEMELLAGRRSEADVAILRNLEIEAKRQLALAEIALEDAEVDEQKLAANIEKQRKAAKQIAAESIRSRYRQALYDVKVSMERSMAADLVLNQVLRDLDSQFPGARLPNGNQLADVDGFDQRLKLRHQFSGGERIPTLLEQIDQALAEMDREG